MTKDSFKMYNIWSNIAEIESFYLESLLSKVFSQFKTGDLRYVIASTIINRYPNLKECIIDRANQSRDSKQDLLDGVRKAHKEIFSTVEIDLPDSISRNKLEITEENGMNIGTINFGEQTVRIITSGEIILVDKREKKVKEKKIDIIG